MCWGSLKGDAAGCVILFSFDEVRLPFCTGLGLKSVFCPTPATAILRCLHSGVGESVLWYKRRRQGAKWKAFYSKATMLHAYVGHVCLLTTMIEDILDHQMSRSGTHRIIPSRECFWYMSQWATALGVRHQRKNTEPYANNHLTWKKRPSVTSWRYTYIQAEALLLSPTQINFMSVRCGF